MAGPTTDEPAFLRSEPVYDRPGLTMGGHREGGTPTPYATYAEPFVETIRRLIMHNLPRNDVQSVISTYGVGDAAPDYQHPLTANDVETVRRRGRGTIELSSGDTEATTATPYLTLGMSVVYIDVFGRPYEADRLRRLVDAVLVRARVDAAHALGQWDQTASAIQAIRQPVPAWHHIAEDDAAGTVEQWAGEIECGWQIRTP